MHLAEVARRVAVTRTTVSAWNDVTQRRWSAGAQAPTAADLRGWTRQQKVALVRLVKDGALAQGFAPELWTSRRVRQMIEEKFF